MYRRAAIALLIASRVFAADAEEVLEPNDKVLIAAVCALASIPAPHALAGQIEVGALRGEKNSPRVLPPTFGWVSISTDEKSLRSPAEQYAKELGEALRIVRSDRYPAPCVGESAMERVVITAVIRTPKGYVALAALDATVKTLPAPEADLAKAQVAAMKLANELAETRLAPTLVRNLYGKAIRSGRLTRDWSQTP